jgi:hypothetical protein
MTLEQPCEFLSGMRCTFPRRDLNTPHYNGKLTARYCPATNPTQQDN